MGLGVQNVGLMANLPSLPRKRHLRALSGQPSVLNLQLYPFLRDSRTILSRSMMLTTKIRIALLCYFTAILLVPFYPHPYTFFIDTVGSVVSLVAITFFFTFYSVSILEMQRSCIQGLSQLMLVCLSLLIIYNYLKSLMTNVLHDFTQSFLLDYPYLSCCLINTRLTRAPLLLSYLMLLVSRLALLLATMRFQSMNHKRIVQVGIALTVGIPLTDLLISSGVSYFSYCNLRIMNRFVKKNKFTVKTDQIKNSYSDPMFLFL